MSKSPKDSGDLSALSEVAPELAEMLVSVASDIALVVDNQGVVSGVALGGAEPFAATASNWVGRRWADTVTTDTRRKIEELLAEATTEGVSRTRHVNHPSAIGTDIPVAYTAVRLGHSGPVLVVGRDLRAVSAMQQRLVDTQQAMEKDYWRMRQAETRYRLLFQIASDAVLVLDGDTLRVIDANRSAARLYGLAIEDLIGNSPHAGLDTASVHVVEDLLGRVRVAGRAAEAQVSLAAGGRRIHVTVTPFRAEGLTLLLMRARPEGTTPVADESSELCRSLVERTSDAVVFADDLGRVIGANKAFLDLVQLADEGQAKGRLVSEWIGGSALEFESVISAVKQSAVSRLTATLLRNEAGASMTVEVSAARIDSGQEQCVGLIVRVTTHGASNPPEDRSFH